MSVLPENNHDVNHYLMKTIQHLIENWYKEDVGIVAAAIIDQGRCVFATSVKQGENFLYAERNAYQKFIAKYGEISSDAICVTTISPCVQPLRTRKEPSCSDLLKEVGIKKVHCGTLDQHHVSQLSDYTPWGFTATVTQDNKMARICKKLVLLFETYGHRISTDTLAIKKELGEAFFEEFQVTTPA